MRATIFQPASEALFLLFAQQFLGIRIEGLELQIASKHLN